MKYLAALSSGILILPALGFAQYPGAVRPPADLAPGFEAISQAFAREVLGFLAGSTTEGRGTGQPGFQVAADYVAAKFKEFGLKPVGDNGTYFQNLTVYRATPIADSVSVSIDGSAVPLKAGLDLTFTNLVGDVDSTGMVAVLSPGKDEVLAKTQDLSKKIVIVSARTVSPKLRTAISLQQPLAVLYVDDRAAERSPNVSLSKPVNSPQQNFVGTIRRELAAKILNAMESGGSMALVGGHDTTEVVFLKKSIHITAKFEAEGVQVPNVVGLLEGSDPTMKAEIVGVGAHLDHLGINHGVVYPGADDDGSGSTAVVSIAKAFSINPRKPKRSILFMTFCGEEKGLWGSSFYSDHPIFPHNQMISELQMDMIARDSYGPQNGNIRRTDLEKDNVKTMRLVGSKRISTELDKLVQEMNQYIAFKFLYDSEDVYTRSDHYNFAKKGVPIAFLFDGFTPDYHQPSDTLDKIDFVKLVSAARLYYLTAMTLANQVIPPKKDVPQK